jgi:ubiquitin C-terminal hydrolase
MLERSPDESRQPVARPPLNRDVARPVANLGNTCYMNAVLQALAHAPELCMAMDVESHRANCPIFMENAQKRRSSPSSSPDAVSDLPAKSTGTRKSRRSGSGKRSPTNQENDDCKFCALCEVEHHLTRVHTNTNNREKPVAPSMFVNGFIDRVAPWFKLGQQEDSHEFLRLLIDAMQRSCKQARTQENPQDTPPEKMSEDGDDDDQGPEDMEYSFQLFRGTVESNVTCDSCKSTSSTLDPIEDIGLDVTPVSSSSSSPPPGFLADVGTALQRFARAEALDSGYKCEKCGKVGRATKQSRLASIPPILTLHLKRFRYGETQKTVQNSNGQSTRRSNRSSEVSQLLGPNSGGDYFTGKSGSAKIEGHSKFQQILDLKPYLTEELQAKHSNMFSRLFAVIVHAGKNSHSGHYIAYVRNIAKNEWWKMDDARITVASVHEVMNAEAYMLFYRVVEHPFAIQLRNQAKKLQDDYSNEVAQEASTKALASSEPIVPKEEVKVADASKTDDISSVANNNVAKSNAHKRKAPEFTCGEDWAHAKTTLPDNVESKFKDIEQMISEYVQFKPEFFKLLMEQASKGNAKVGHGPSSGVCGTLGRLRNKCTPK